MYFWLFIYCKLWDQSTTFVLFFLYLALFFGKHATRYSSGPGNLVTGIHYAQSTTWSIITMITMISMGQFGFANSITLHEPWEPKRYYIRSDRRVIHSTYIILGPNLVVKIHSKRRWKDIIFQWLFLVFLGFWPMLMSF